MLFPEPPLKDCTVASGALVKLENFKTIIHNFTMMHTAPLPSQIWGRTPGLSSGHGSQPPAKIPPGPYTLVNICWVTLILSRVHRECKSQKQAPSAGFLRKLGFPDQLTSLVGKPIGKQTNSPAYLKFQARLMAKNTHNLNLINLNRGMTITKISEKKSVSWQKIMLLCQNLE